MFNVMITFFDFCIVFCRRKLPIITLDFFFIRINLIYLKKKSNVMIGSFLLQKTMQNPKSVIITSNIRSHCDFSPGTQPAAALAGPVVGPPVRPGAQRAASLAGPEVRRGMQRAAPLAKPVVRPGPQRDAPLAGPAVRPGTLRCVIVCAGGPLHLLVVMRKAMSV